MPNKADTDLQKPMNQQTNKQILRLDYQDDRALDMDDSSQALVCDRTVRHTSAEAGIDRRQQVQVETSVDWW